MQDRAWLIGALFATILTLMTFCQTSRAQMITPITLEEPPAETPSPAALTRQKLARKGMVDGADASISLNFVSASLGNVLDYIAVTAQGKPHEIQIIIDGKGIEDAGFRLSKNELTFNVHNISLQQALRLVLDEELDFRVQDDGSVIVSSNERLWREIGRAHV